MTVCVYRDIHTLRYITSWFSSLGLCKRMFMCCVNGGEEANRHTAKCCRSVERADVGLRDIMGVALCVVILC